MKKVRRRGLPPGPPTEQTCAPRLNGKRSVPRGSVCARRAGGFASVFTSRFSAGPAEASGKEMRWGDAGSEHLRFRPGRVYTGEGCVTVCREKFVSENIPEGNSLGGAPLEFGARAGAVRSHAYPPPWAPAILGPPASSPEATPPWLACRRRVSVSILSDDRTSKQSVRPILEMLLWPPHSRQPGSETCRAAGTSRKRAAKRNRRKRSGSSPPFQTVPRYAQRTFAEIAGTLSVQATPHPT